MMPRPGSPGGESPGDPAPAGHVTAPVLRRPGFRAVAVPAALAWAVIIPLAVTLPGRDAHDTTVLAIMTSTATVCMFIWSAARQGRRDRELLAERLTEVLGTEAGRASAEAVADLCTEFFGAVAAVTGPPARPAGTRLHAVSGGDGG